MRDVVERHGRSFTANLGSCPIAVAELPGAYHALDLAWSLGYTRLILELDSSSAICLIQNTTNGHHPFAILIRKIHQLINQNWEVQIHHVFREANRVFFCEPPIGFGEILAKDDRGVALPRLIR